MAYSLSYPTDNNRWPNRKEEISREAEQFAMWQLRQLGKHNLYIKL